MMKLIFLPVDNHAKKEAPFGTSMKHIY